MTVHVRDRARLRKALRDLRRSLAQVCAVLTKSGRHDLARQADELELAALAALDKAGASASCR